MVSLTQIGSILSGVASAKLSLIESLKFADNIELTVHFHLGDEIYPSAMVQFRDSSSEEPVAQSTFVLEENPATTEPPELEQPPKKEIPFHIGSHIVLDDKLFIHPEEINYQYSPTVQFVPVYEGKGLAHFMDNSARTFDLERGNNMSIYITLDNHQGKRKKYHIKNKKYTLDNKDVTWEFFRIQAREYIKIPDNNTEIVSFDDSAIDFVSLISRKHLHNQTQHWIIAFSK